LKNNKKVATKISQKSEELLSIGVDIEQQKER
jgi:4'-phosphopantetheinyl transferase EntD